MALVQYGHDSESEEEDITTPIEKLPPGLGSVGLGIPISKPKLASETEDVALKKPVVQLAPVYSLVDYGEEEAPSNQKKEESNETTQVTPLSGDMTVEFNKENELQETEMKVNGELWMVGWNSVGQLGLGHTEEVLLPAKVTPLPPVSSVSCGWNHTLILSEEGQVFVCGSNSFGQLGTGDDVKMISQPQALQQKYFNDQKVINLAAGLRHSLAVTVDGCVYSWGNSRKGQLGIGLDMKANVMQPVKVTSLEGHVIKSVAAGSYHSMALSKAGDLLMWGLNDYGQCGTLPPMKENQLEQENIAGEKKIMGISPIWLPRLVKEINNVSKIHSGWSHVAIVTTGKEVCMWGRNTYCELGVGSEVMKFSSNPAHLSDVKNIQQVTCGSEHTMILNGCGSLLSWGWNEHGMCGDGTEVDVSKPKLVSHLEGKSIVKIGTGAGHSFAIVTE